MYSQNVHLHFHLYLERELEDEVIRVLGLCSKGNILTRKLYSDFM